MKTKPFAFEPYPSPYGVEDVHDIGAIFYHWHPFWEGEHGTVFYCHACKSWLPDEGLPCGHVWESHCEDSGCLSGPIEDPACDCATEEACREKAEKKTR